MGCAFHRISKKGVNKHVRDVKNKPLYLHMDLSLQKIDYILLLYSLGNFKGQIYWMSTIFTVNIKPRARTWEETGTLENLEYAPCYSIRSPKIEGTGQDTVHLRQCNMSLTKFEVILWLPAVSKYVWTNRIKRHLYSGTCLFTEVKP